MTHQNPFLTAPQQKKKGISLEDLSFALGTKLVAPNGKTLKSVTVEGLPTAQVKDGQAQGITLDDVAKSLAKLKEVETKRETAGKFSIEEKPDGTRKITGTASPELPIRLMPEGQEIFTPEVQVREMFRRFGMDPDTARDLHPATIRLLASESQLTPELLSDALDFEAQMETHEAADILSRPLETPNFGEKIAAGILNLAGLPLRVLDPDARLGDALLGIRSSEAQLRDREMLAAGTEVRGMLVNQSIARLRALGAGEGPGSEPDPLMTMGAQVLQGKFSSETSGAAQDVFDVQSAVANGVSLDDAVRDFLASIPGDNGGKIPAAQAALDEWFAEVKASMSRINQGLVTSPTDVISRQPTNVTAKLARSANQYFQGTVPIFYMAMKRKLAEFQGERKPKGDKKEKDKKKGEKIPRTLLQRAGLITEGVESGLKALLKTPGQLNKALGEILLSEEQRKKLGLPKRSAMDILRLMKRGLL